MAASDKLAAFLANAAGINRAADQGGSNTTTITGIAAADSEDGTVKVRVSGADVIGPEDADGVQNGDDTIEVPIIGSAQKGDSITVLGVGNGIADTPVVIGGAGSGDRMAASIELAEQAAEEAAELAGEANEAAEATAQHFWADTQGVHVATEADDGDTGPNLLANSLGVLLRIADKIRSAHTPSGFAVYDGLGNTAANIIAFIGSVITLGKQGDNQLIVSGDGIEGAHEYGPYLIAKFEEVQQGSGTVHQGWYMFGDNGQLQTRRHGGYSAAFGVGSEAVGTASFAGGSNSKAEKNWSFAFGGNAVADGVGSTVFGDSTYAKNYTEFACGKYNVKDASGDTLFSVGCGWADNDRHNALTVKCGNGTLGVPEVSTDLGYVMAADTLFSDPTAPMGALNWLCDGGSFSDIHQYKKLEIFFVDSLGNKGSVAVWDPQGGEQVVLTTTAANSNANAFVVRSALVKIPTSGSMITTVSGWQTEYSYNTQNQGGGLVAGSYINITHVIGYY